MVSLTCVQSQTGSICQTSAFGVIRFPDRSHRARCKCAPETGGRGGLERAGDGNVPGKEQTKLEAGQTSTHCAREESGYGYISPPSKPLPPQQIQQRKRNESKRVRQNKAVGSANNHGAPWPCVGNEGREGRRNVRRVVLMKGIAVLSAVHSANC